MLGLSPILAQSDVWPVKGKLLGKDGSKSEDVSGIACTSDEGFPRSCLVIDDETQTAHFVTLLDEEIKAGDTVPLIDNEFKGNPLELDGEAVAYADHAFYIIGSHGHPRDKQSKLDPVHDGDEIRAKIAASSQLVRIRVNARDGRMLTKDDVIDIKVSTALRSITAANEVLKRFVDRRLDNNGLTSEGLAIIGDRLFVGLRQPSSDHGQTPVLSVKLQSLFEGGVAEPKLHLLSVGEGRGIRDLAPFHDGILVLAGPAGDADEISFGADARNKTLESRGIVLKDGELDT